MTAGPASLHPPALAEAEAAVAWYADRSVTAATRFLTELETSIEHASARPNAFPPYIEGTRRILLRRFPYFLVYRQAGSGIEIVAVAHGSRRPGYWRERC